MITDPTAQPHSQGTADQQGFEDNTMVNEATATKSVVLLCELLKRQKKSFEAGLEIFIQTFLHPILLTLGGDRYSALLENRATECLALFCSLSRPLAEQYFSTFCNVAVNNDKSYRNQLQVLATKAITDMALTYHGELELDDTTIDSTMSSTQTSQVERSKEIHARVGEILQDVYAKSERREYASVDVKEDEEPIGYVLIKCITRLLFRGHCNDDLMSLLTVYILSNSHNADELRKVSNFDIRLYYNFIKKGPVSIDNKRRSRQCVALNFEEGSDQRDYTRSINLTGSSDANVWTIDQSNIAQKGD